MFWGTVIIFVSRTRLPLATQLPLRGRNGPTAPVAALSGPPAMLEGSMD